MADTTTEAILRQATVEQMVELHNQLPGVLAVTRFSDPSTAQARLRLALERTEMKLARIERQPGVFRVVPVGAASVTRRSGALQKRIRILVDHNPKQRGASRERFALYRDGMTMAEYIDTVLERWPSLGNYKARKDLYHDRDRGYIRLEE